MTRADVIAKLEAAEPALRACGVAALYLFGSHARDEANARSDIDVFVDKTPGRRFGLSEFLGAYRALQNAIPGAEFGYATREGIVDVYRRAIERDAIKVF